MDDLTSGRLENIQGHLASGTVEFLNADLREPGVTRMAMHGVDTVFHLAADHGGRGYVDLHQAGPASNFFLDGLVFAEAVKAGVRKVVFASSRLRLSELSPIRREKRSLFDRRPDERPQRRR